MVDRSLFMRIPSLVLMPLCALAFDPCAKGWYGESALSATVSSVKYQGSGRAGVFPYSATGAIGQPIESPGRGGFSLLGAEIKETLGWKQWFSLEIIGAYSRSLGATASRTGDDWATSNRAWRSGCPARLSLWDLSVSAFTSLALDKSKSIFIEPSVGYSYLLANMGAAVWNNPIQEWEKLKFSGPTLGLYMRLFATPKIGFRVGGGYMASRLSIEKFNPAGINTDAFPYDPGFVGKHSYKTRRHGLKGLVRIDYLWKSWVNIHAALDYQSWSAGGFPADGPGFFGASLYGNTVTSPMLQRYRLVWGADFTY